MTPAWWFFFGSVAALSVSGYLFRRTDVDLYLVAVMVSCLCVLMFGIGGLIVSLGRHYGRITCNTFATNTGRRTRFVIYTSWSGGDCLTPTGNGRWIPISNLREFGSKP